MLENKISSIVVNQTLWKEVDSIRSFSMICLQLALVGFAIDQFNVEVHLGLPQLMPIVFIAFIVNAVLPKAHRLTFFFFASLVPIVYFFGWWDGILLIIMALLMVGTCHLPISLPLRKLGVLILGGGLAYTKYLLSNYMLAKGTFPEGFSASSQMISVLGAMFMFRVILYLYELKYEKEKASVWQRLSYFFMLPNICFPIFPIVDYKTFNRTYYDEADLVIYQKGLNLVVLGLIQLLVYRVLYYLTPSAADVTGFWILLRYLVLSYLMLVRLNGILNVAVGLLRLFGFNLPDIFNYMFLAKGFDDLWRRINIYWKDFMVKIVYYPLYFKFKKKGKIFALVVGTLFTFILNWLFHAYQWFWVLGEFPFRNTEILTWAILGILVLISILRQQKKLEKGTLFAQNKKQSPFVSSGLILFTFGMMTLIYSLMISPTIEAWLKIMSALKLGTIVDWGIVVTSCFFPYLVFVWMFRLEKQGRFSEIKTFFTRPKKIMLLNIFLLGGILFLSSGLIDKQVKRFCGFSTKPFINHHLNTGDQRKQFNGYYEELMFADNFSSVLWQMEYKKPIDWLNVTNLELMKYTGFLSELEPSSETVFKKGRLSTNRWGLRDRDYEKQRPENTLRIAVIGGSAEMGAGVHDEEVFEQVLENKLNNQLGSDTAHFEILNFAISGMSVFRHIEKLRLQALSFQPQYVLVFVHKGEDAHIYKTLKWLSIGRGSRKYTQNERDTIPWVGDFENYMENEKIQYSEIASYKEKSEVGWKMINWGYGEIKKLCYQNGVEMIIVFNPGIVKTEEDDLPFQKIANELDVPFINLSGLYDDYTIEELQIAIWDNHPNALGHQIMAEKLYPALVPYLKITE
ncbi:MAG: D-alanyl-lipoteichoic acid acyltransferase DltB (MBOAT superfamily) [Saprospiraceae bacterium]|jgi:D-alanyl-lipoteichoic acid acyltransferase DltB (MBOAT superfamily)